MPAKYHAEGRSIPYKPVAAVSAGQLVKVETYVGVADNDIPANKLGALTVVGIYRVTSAIITTVTAGTEMDVNFTTQALVANASGDADVKVFVAADTAPLAGGYPTPVPVFLNRWGG